MGKPTPATSTTTIQQDPAAQELKALGLPFLRQFAENPPQLPTGPLTAGFDPLQTAGQEAVLGQTGTQSNIVGDAAKTSHFLSGDVLNPESNPALGKYISAATLPLYQNLTENVLPSIRSGAETTGNFGSTRQGIAEGLAAGRTAQAAGSVSADIANKGYQAGLDSLVKNLALTPQTAQSQLIPGVTTSGVGDVRQALTQAQLQEANLRQIYPQLLPFLMGSSLFNTASTIQPVGTTTTGQASAQNPITQGLGLGIAGLGALGSLGGSAGIAGLAPLLAISDRRLKRDVTRIGTFKGIPVYNFRYRGSDEWQVGVMADEAPAYAIIDFLGFKIVDYGAL